MNQERLTKVRYIYLDHLRCLAILGVIAAHASSILNNQAIFGVDDYTLGRFGVQLFFLISGYTAWLSLRNVQDNLKMPWWGAFYIKRGFRVIPLFFIFSFLIFMINGCISPASYFSPLAGFFPDSLNIVPGGWSIWNEIYFYLSLPIYAQIRKRKSLIALSGAGLSLVSGAIGMSHLGDISNYTTQVSDFDYLNIFSQFIFFQIGLELGSKNRSNITIFFLSFFSTSLAIKVLFSPNNLLTPDYGSGYINSLIAIFISMIFLLYKSCSHRVIYAIGSNTSNLISQIGRTTFTMYVVHFGIIKLIKISNIEVFRLAPLEIIILLVFIATFYLSRLIQPLTETTWASLGEAFIKEINSDRPRE